MTNVTAFSSRSVPWMFYGAKVLEGKGVGVDEALQLSGLDFDVTLRRAAYQSSDGLWVPHQGRAAVVRKDTDKPLGAVSSTYEILQYKDAFKFIDELGHEIMAAGTHDGGAHGFIVTQDPQHRTIAAGRNGEDEHDLYVVLRTSHDGSQGVEVAILPLRHMCMNMMPGVHALKGSHQRWTFRHTKNLGVRMAQVQSVIKGVPEYVAEFEAISKRLADIDITIDEAREVLDEIVPDTLKSKEGRVNQLLDLYQHSPVNGYTGNGWGLVNAVSEFYDHRPGRRESTRWTRGLDGSTYRETARATELLLRRA